MRRKIIAGNWKMNMTCSGASELVNQIKPLIAGRDDVDVVVCPPFTALQTVRDAIQGSRIGLGAQDVFWKEKGAYTGQIAPSMLTDLGVSYVIVGHSESRGRFGVPEPDFTDAINRHFGETDESVNRKLKAAIGAGLTPICCVGETIGEREEGATDEVVWNQTRLALEGIKPEHAIGLVFAYEPVWAIGTGEVCDAEEAERVCRMIRFSIARLYDADVAQRVRIQYGGSMKPDNAAELLAQPDIDGGLVGGASLKAADFAAIVNASQPQ